MYKKFNVCIGENWYKYLQKGVLKVYFIV